MTQCSPRRIILGVTGGIAAYKAALLLRLLTEAGHRVRVVPTESALRMVGRPTWEALSHEPVHTGVFDAADEVEHVRLGREADLVILAPATAHTMARCAAGMADDLLTATVLTATCPILMAPAMHTEMWENPATVANVALLRERGITILDPDSGRLTGADTGRGRLPEPERIAQAALALVDAGDGEAEGSAAAAQAGSLRGRRVVVSAGGTREPLDPVRFLGNRSSGRQGVALALEAARQGAETVLVACNVDSSITGLLPSQVRIEHAGSTLELQQAMDREAHEADVVIMAAAVADFRPATQEEGKIKKREGQSAPTITLVENPDILAGLAANRPHPAQLVVGFAAETGDEHGSVLDYGRAKARRKGADLLAVNHVGDTAGFGDVGNAITVLDGKGTEVGQGAGTKDDVARELLRVIADHLPRDLPAE